MEASPPIKPPRGVKPVKETSGLLMSVIRALSSSETNEQRDREKAKLENDYKISDRKLEDLISRQEGDLANVMQIFSSLSHQVSDSKEKIARVKENLRACKSLLHCQRDELKQLWQEGLEYKYMLQLLEEIEKINELPTKLSHHLNKKQYLQATKLLVQAVSLGRDNLEGVEGLKEFTQDLLQKRDSMHKEILNELKQQLYHKPCQNVLALQRQGSGCEIMTNSQFRRSTELRRSTKNRASVRKLLTEANTKQQTNDDFEVDEDIDINPDSNPSQYMAVLVKSLALLEKIPLAVKHLEIDMENDLLHIIQRTTHHINDFSTLQNDDNRSSRSPLLELFQIIFNQFKDIADAHVVFLNYVNKAKSHYKLDVPIYSIKDVWIKIQNVLQSLLGDYLDIQTMNGNPQISESFASENDISSYFLRKKQPVKKKIIFKFDGSSSAITMQSCMGSIAGGARSREKVLVCASDASNILVLYIPFTYFIEEIEQALSLPQGTHCDIHKFLSFYIENDYLKQKFNEVYSKIQELTRLNDTWKSTILLDVTTDYKPLLESTVTIESCIRVWKTVLEALPTFSNLIVSYTIETLKEYRSICSHAYQKIVQTPGEDKKICSAAWLKDEDISRFLQSLPNWVNLKDQQEFQARYERKKMLRREQTLDEESPEDVRQRNRKEAEILAGNLGEGGVSSNEILSNMSILKELAQLQESMEWFSVRMLQFTSELRQSPSNISDMNVAVAILPTNLQQLTSIAQSFDELANTCLLLLHLEVRVQCFHYLQTQTNYNKETHEPDPKVLELSRVLANVDEAMTTSLHPRKCKYIFEGLGHLIAKILISSAQYMTVIDELVIQRMCRNVFALQQTLTNITMTREVALDHARHYYELFFSTPDEIFNNIVEKGAEFSELEYMNAIQLLHRSKKDKRLGNIKDDLDKLLNVLNNVGITI